MPGEPRSRLRARVAQILFTTARLTTACNDVPPTSVYEFTMGATGDVVKARYTYTYVFEQNQWKIAHHHSCECALLLPAAADVVLGDWFRLLG